MPVISAPLDYLLKKTHIESKEELLETLNDMGYPSEEEEDIVYVELTPDRLDMIPIEGTIRAVLSFRGGITREYAFKDDTSFVDVRNEGVDQRPFICGFLAEGVEDKDYLYESLIETQEKIHKTYGRKRRKIAIGIHNADKVDWRNGLTYKAVDDVEFVPLTWTKSATLEQILEEHEKGQKYGALVNKPYPMLFDSKGVISFPPIINSERTKVDEHTENFLVDITGTNEYAIQSTAKVFATAFADRGAKITPFKVNGQTCFNLHRRALKLTLERVKVIGGVKLSFDEVAAYLKKADILAEKVKAEDPSNDEIVAHVPTYRIDISRDVDVIEEVLIGYGYNNIEAKEPEVWQDGSLLDRWEKERNAMLRMGFWEIFGYYLVSASLQEKLGLDQIKVVASATQEHNSLRRSTLLTLLMAEEKNKMVKLPHKFFESGKIYLPNIKKKLNELGFLVTDKEVSVERGVAIVKRFARELGCNNLEVKEGAFELEHFFIKGRVHTLSFCKYKAVVGELNPNINEMFNIINPMLAGFIRKTEGESKN